MSAIAFRTVPMQEEPAWTLAQAMRAEIADLYEDVDLDGPDMPRASPAELGPPGGAFLVGFAPDGTAVCCGGLKALPDGACEIKRMYVVPEARGQGIARALLGALEERARELGYGIARLDSGPRQLGAQHLYRTAGYRDIENFNGNPVATYFGEKGLR